jgi:hypothetical protein
MHTFGSGQFAGLTVEQAMLRDAPTLYRLMQWAREEGIRGLANALRDFDALRQKLRNAAIKVNCDRTGCGATARSLTFPIDQKGEYGLPPDYWCREHDPSGGGISEKFPIHFDAIRHMKRKGERELLFRRLRVVFGIANGVRITKKFAQDFFAGCEALHRGL